MCWDVPWYPYGSINIHRTQRQATAKKGGGKGSSKYRIIEYALANGGKRSKVLSLRGPPLFLEASRDGQFVVAACATRLCVWSARERELWTAVAFDDKKPREGSLLQVSARVVSFLLRVTCIPLPPTRALTTTTNHKHHHCRRWR